MKKLLLTFFLFSLCSLAFAQSVRPHPRLLTGPGGRLFTEEETASAPVWVRRADSLVVATSNSFLEVPPVEHIKTGIRLLDVSREAFKRIFYLSYTYRVHGGEIYARRAIEEMLAVSAFSDWNPTHFLDAAEMTMAVSIGYDWLYEVMTLEERKKIAQAILEKGFDASDDKKNAWFYTAKSNWNSVCNAGLIFGAAALWDEFPDRCREILDRSLKSNPLALAAFSDEGGYPEGYNYWGYGVSFQTLLFDALETAFGTDFGLLSSCRKAFLATSKFMQFMSTPSGWCFNFSDSPPRANAQAAQAWMAFRTGDGSLLYPEVRIMEKTGYLAISEDRIFPFLLVVLSRMGIPSIQVPTDHFYHCGGQTPVFIYRSGWESPTDTYLGVKGGLSQSAHGHCDQGSFVFESNGVRWAIDLGMQDYYSLEKEGVNHSDKAELGQRWSVFRLGPFSHNILTVNGHTPKVNHQAEMVQIWSESDRYGCEIELGKIYSEDFAAYRRDVWTDGKEELNVIDYIETGDSTCVVRWALCTTAEAQLLADKSPGCQFSLSGNKTQKQLSFSVLKHWEGRQSFKWKKGSELGIRAEILPTSAPGPHLHYYDTPNTGTVLLCYSVTIPPRTRVRLEAKLR